MYIEFVVPSTKTLKEGRKVPIGIDFDRDESTCQIYKKKKFVVNLNNKCDNAPETDRLIVCEKGGFFYFTESFVCLGSTLTFLLLDAIDVKNRILKATKVMGALHFMWESK